VPDSIPNTSNSTPTDRRPIAARSWAFSATLTNACVRLGLSPNQVSILGMLAGIGAGVCLALTPHFGYPRVLWFAAAALIQLRLLANMLDGMVAVATGRTSHLGELYNDVPDRISDSCVLIGLGYAAGGSLELGYLGAVLAILTAYVRAVGKAAGAGSDFRGPMAKQQRMFLVTVVSVYQAFAPANWIFTYGPGDRWGPAADILALICLGAFITCVRRLIGIASILRKKSA
jgi:phosphatidylglycerophosphate synthase